MRVLSLLLFIFFAVAVQGCVFKPAPKPVDGEEAEQAEAEPKHPTGFRDYIESHGELTREQFYALVTCGRPPGGTCLWPARKWPSDKAQNLTVAIWHMDESYPPIDGVYARRALRDAVREINAIGAGVRLRIVQDNPDIRVYVKDLPPFTRIRDIPYMAMNGVLLQGAVFKMGPLLGPIKRGVIVMSNVSRSRKTGELVHLGARWQFMQSTMLEELMQVLGFPWDIRNPQYENRSVFEQDSNSVVSLWGHDSWVLHRHYPAR